jgi:hypothetical protein
MARRKSGVSFAVMARLRHDKPPRDPTLTLPAVPPWEQVPEYPERPRDESMPRRGLKPLAAPDRVEESPSPWVVVDRFKELSAAQKVTSRQAFMEELDQWYEAVSRADREHGVDRDRANIRSQIRKLLGRHTRLAERALKLDGA